MKKIFSEGYLFLILFIIFLIKEPIIKLLNFNNSIYNTIRCSIMEEDYNKLLEFNDIDLVYEYDYFNTYILFKDVYNYMNEITIKGGKDKNLDKNPIIYDNTLVGVINKVNESSSIVRLITNKDSKISVKINDEIGVLESINGELYVKNINNYANINIGDDIYTSGLGNINENFYIGKVKFIGIDNKNIEKIIKVDYKLNIKDLLYVTVIKENI